MEEVIKIAEENRIPLQISHHAGGTGEVRKRACRAVEEALARGVSIGHDNIPWACGPTTVLALLPPWLFDGGTATGLKRLQDAKAREQVIDELNNHVPTWPTWKNRYWTDKFLNFESRFGGFRKEHNVRFRNMTMTEIARQLDKNPYQALFDLIIPVHAAPDHCL